MKLDRRDFLKGGLAMGGIAAMAGLAGCGPAQAGASTAAGAGVPAEWDHEADIIAIGAGGAGLAAAIEARELGLEIIVLESQDIVGGNSAICGGGIAIPGTPLQKEAGIEDSVDTMFEDLCAWFDTDYDEDYVRTLCELNAGLYDWLTSQGIEFLESGLLQSNGHSRPREHHVNPGLVISTLEANAEAAGADIRTGVTATRLVQDPATKTIVGVMAGEGERAEYYKARRGVLLCTGGYSLNLEMLCDWNFGPQIYDLPFAAASPGQDGSGIKMAMAVGADTRHMSYCAMITNQQPEGGPTDACAMYHQGAILVNKEGERFVDEAQGYTNVWPELLEQTDAICYQIWDDAIAQACYDNDSAYYNHSKVAETGFLLTADTIEDLAAQIGVPAETLVTTVERYNADVQESGVDSVFGRAHLSGTGAAPLALQTPPFYAFETTCTVGVTYGGIRQDVNQGSQAVDVFGDIIPRLYLAGNISDYCNMGVVAGTRRPINASGVSMGGAMSFGRRAAQEMAKLESWDA